jgi:hypothetical protein
MSFDHIQVYVKSLQSLEYYQDLEAKNNAFCADPQNLQVSEPQDANYSSTKQDIVEQLIWGVGCRVIAAHECSSSRSVLVSSTPIDRLGSRYFVTAPTAGHANASEEDKVPVYFQGEAATLFFERHSGRAGFAVFGFLLRDKGAIDVVYQKCLAKHPRLLRFPEGVRTFTSEDGNVVRVLEIYTFYKKLTSSNQAREYEADEGTVMRFIEKTGDQTAPLPGFRRTRAEFATHHQASFFDHWVSNVMDRKQYLETLDDILGFTPKVDFNAGVVAAGGM